MTVYVESSAIVAWLLEEEGAAAIRRILADADAVVASDLTLIECDRVLHRAVALKELTEAEAADRRAQLTIAAAHWQMLRIGPEVVGRARQPFPGNPVRSLDAIHLASALVARSAVAGVELLSLDERVRKAAAGLGIRSLPQSD